MKKIGIITYYYNSINYGGVLQAYALVKALEKNNVVVEQISYNSIGVQINNKGNNSVKYSIKKAIKHLIATYLNYILKNRYKSFCRFRDEIPHTPKVYDDSNISIISEYYDIYITGSDQVWNTTWYRPTFFLDFVPKNKKKVSYAASIGKKDLSEKESEIFKSSLKNYSAISVREQDSVNLLSSLTNGEVEWVLDPTLLLDKSDWDRIAPAPLVNKKYVFCYFIGDGYKERKLAKKYAKEHDLCLVVLSHPAGFNYSDLGFGDKKMYDAGPADFVSLIKCAEYIFTDSFHACVFSSIYHKQFFVFPRNGKKAMGNRIYSLLSLFDCVDHFCDTDEKQRMEYISNLQLISYKDLNKYIEMKNRSLRFINEKILNNTFK